MLSRCDLVRAKTELRNSPDTLFANAMDSFGSADTRNAPCLGDYEAYNDSPRYNRIREIERTRFTLGLISLYVPTSLLISENIASLYQFAHL